MRFLARSRRRRHAGFDAVAYLIEARRNDQREPPRYPLRYCADCGAKLDMRYGGRTALPWLAEANQWPEDVLQYFGAGDECHMAFPFPR